MVDQAFDKVEDPKTYQESAHHHLAGPPEMGLAGRPPKHHKAKRDENIRTGVENAVPKRVELEVLDGVGRVPGAGQHVMPLQNLMQNDPVEKPAEAKSEQNSC